MKKFRILNVIVICRIIDHMLLVLCEIVKSINKKIAKTFEQLRLVRDFRPYVTTQYYYTKWEMWTAINNCWKRLKWKRLTPEWNESSCILMWRVLLCFSCLYICSIRYVCDVRFNPFVPRIFDCCEHLRYANSLRIERTITRLSVLPMCAMSIWGKQNRKSSTIHFDADRGIGLNFTISAQFHEF